MFFTQVPSLDTKNMPNKVKMTGIPFCIRPYPRYSSYLRDEITPLCSPSCVLSNGNISAYRSKTLKDIRDLAAAINLSMFCLYKEQ